MGEKGNAPLNRRRLQILTVISRGAGFLHVSVVVLRRTRMSAFITYVLWLLMTGMLVWIVVAGGADKRVR